MSLKIEEFYVVGGGNLLILLLMLLGWGVIVPAQAATILSHPLSDGTPVKPVSYDSDALDLVNTDFTLAACVNISKYNDNYAATIFSKRGTDNGWFFGLDTNKSAYANGLVKFRNVTDQSVVRSKSTITLNKTHDVVMVYKLNTHTASIYIDGILDSSGYVSSPSPSHPPVRIGKDSEWKAEQGFPHVWNGKLSDLQIHNLALTEEEIKKHDVKCRGLLELTVTKNGEGTVAAGQAINCGTQCKTQLTQGSSITLTATPKTGHIFTGWTNACTGTATTCSVSMNSAKTVTATFKPLFNLSVSKTGNGTVTSTGINCGTDCTESYTLNTVVNLNATPSTGYVFGGWTGCTSATAMCQVTMDKAKTVTAIFRPILTVNKTGEGTVTSTGINCGTDCTESYVLNTPVTLTATPSTGYVFGGWTGCTSTTATCQVTMDKAKTVTATFKPILTVNNIGEGTVSSSPAGIDCGGDCTEDYALDTVVTLTAVSNNPDFTFAEWTGDCSGKEITCKVTMSQAKTVNARFIPPNVDITDENDDGFACITGTGLGIHFSWLLRGINGNTVSNLNAGTTLGDPATTIAPYFEQEIASNGIHLVVNGECIELGNYTLFVGPPGATPQCEVTSAGCKFNPTIRWVSKTQMLTSIRGFIWNDPNESGLQDSHETYLPEWAVILKDANGVETSTVSDADGYYEFTGLTAGNYTVTVETRTGATYTTSQLVTGKVVDSVKIPGSANFGIGEVGVKDDPVDSGTGNDDTSNNDDEDNSDTDSTGLPGTDEEKDESSNPNKLCSEVLDKHDTPMHLMAKFEWQNGGYVQVEGAGNFIDLKGDATQGSWSVLKEMSNLVDVDAVILKGATGTFVYSYEPTAKSADEFSNLKLPLNNGGQVPAISNIQFCEDGHLSVEEQVCVWSANQDAEDNYVELRQEICIPVEAGKFYAISLEGLFSSVLKAE